MAPPHNLAEYYQRRFTIKKIIAQKRSGWIFLKHSIVVLITLGFNSASCRNRLEALLVFYRWMMIIYYHDYMESVYVKVGLTMTFY